MRRIAPAGRDVIVVVGTQEVGLRTHMPLYYLASAKWVNNKLLGKVRTWEGGDTVWRNN